MATMAAHAYPIHAIRLRAPVARDALAAAVGAADDKATLKGACSDTAHSGHTYNMFGCQCRRVTLHSSQHRKTWKVA
jgi:hypothetical protein